MKNVQTPRFWPLSPIGRCRDLHILGIIWEVYLNMCIIHLETSTKTSPKYRSPTLPWFRIVPYGFRMGSIWFHMVREMCAPLARNHAFSINVRPSCTKPLFSEKCVPLLHETILFREMCAPLARNHTFSINVCPSCTKAYFFDKCVPLLHETTLFCKKTPKAARVDTWTTLEICPPPGPNAPRDEISPFRGTPHSDIRIFPKLSRVDIFAHQSQKSESYTARLPFGSTKKT